MTSFENDYAFQNSPPSLKDAFKHYASETLTNLRKNFALALTNVDIDGACFYCKILARYQQLKYPLSPAIKVELAFLCHRLLFIPIDIQKQINVLRVFLDLIKNEDLVEQSFELDWHPFYTLYTSIYYSNDGCTISETNSLLFTHKKLLSSVIQKCRQYFTRDSFASIANTFIPLLNPFDICSTRAVHFLNLFLPTKQLWSEMEIKAYKIKSTMNAKMVNDDIPQLIVFLLHHILNENLMVNYTPVIFIELLTRIICHNRNFAVHLEPFLPDLFHFLYQTIEFPINRQQCPLKTCSRLSSNQRMMGGKRNIVQIVNLLIMLMDDGGNEDPIQQKFADFFETASNYFYPDEQQRTNLFSMQLSSFLTTFCTIYAARYWKELRGYDNSNNGYVSNELKQVWNWHSRVNPKSAFYKPIDDRFKLCPSLDLFKSMQPILQWAIYAKSGAIQFSGFTAVKALSTVFPKEMAEWASFEIHECLTAVTQSHRLSIGIRLLDRMTPVFLNRYLLPDSQHNLPRFLDAVLFGIDPSLMTQCIQTLNYLENVFLNVPLINDMGNSNECKSNDGREATFSFTAFALKFIDKIINYAIETSSSLESLKSSGVSAETPGIKNFSGGRTNRAITKTFTKCLKAFWFALSKSIYDECCERVVQTLIGNAHSSILGQIIIKCMIEPYAEQTVPLLLPMVIKKILFTSKNMNKMEYNPSVCELRGSKEVLMFYLGLISAITQPAHESIIPFIPVLSNIITLCMEHKLPEIKNFSSILVQKCVCTLAREYPREWRSSNRWREDGQWKHWRDWGLFKEIELRGLQHNWTPNLHLQWFVPTIETFSAIQKLMNNVLTLPLQQIKHFIDGKVSEQELNAEKLLQYIRIMHYLCLGLGHLGNFDIDDQSQLLNTVKDDNFFFSSFDKNNTPLFSYQTSDNFEIFGKLNELRTMLYLPTEMDDVSLRTAFVRLSIALFRKLNTFSDTKDWSMDEIEDDDDTDEQLSKNTKKKTGSVDLSSILSDSSAVHQLISLHKQRSTDDTTIVPVVTSSSAKEYAGVSKVLFWLSHFQSVLLNNDGVVRNAANIHTSSVHSFLQSLFFDIMTGHKLVNRSSCIKQTYGITLLRLYCLYEHQSYTTDVRLLIEEICKVSVSEFANVRKRAIRAILTQRVCVNFRSGVEYAVLFWIKVLKDEKSSKHHLLGACYALSSHTLISKYIVRNCHRQREYLSAVLGGFIHGHHEVQTKIYAVFKSYMSANHFQTIYLPPALAKDETRRKELEFIDGELRKEHNLMQEFLLSIAIGSSRHKSVSISSDTLSFEQIPSNPNDPIVISLTSLLSTLDLQSIAGKIDVKQIAKTFDVDNISAETLSAFLNKLGFNINPLLFQSLTDQQIRAVIHSTPLGNILRSVKKEKIDSNINNNDESKSNKRNVSASVHWKYQLMSTVLLWKTLRPNIAPLTEVVEYFCSILGSKISSLNKASVMALLTIVHNYMPLLHYKNVLKDEKQYPNDTIVDWLRKSNANVCIPEYSIAEYMKPRALLSSSAAMALYEFISDNFERLGKAIADDHPRMVDKNQPRQSSGVDRDMKRWMYYKHHWPYDGYDVTLKWWEDRHYLLIRDILRCQWPANAMDINCRGWNINSQMWVKCIQLFHSYCEKMNEKEDQLTAAAIFSGIVRAYHHFAAVGTSPIDDHNSLEEFQLFLSSKVCEVAVKAMQKCAVESEEAWRSGIRSALYGADPKLLKWITRPLLEIAVSALQVQHSSKDDGKESIELATKLYISPDKQVRSLRYATEVLVSFVFRGQSEWRYMLNALVSKQENLSFDMSSVDLSSVVDPTVFECFFLHPFHSVRYEVGVTLAHLMRCLRMQPQPLFSNYDCMQSDVQFSALLDIIEKKNNELAEKSKIEERKKSQLQTSQETQMVEEFDDRDTRKYNVFLQSLV